MSTTADLVLALKKELKAAHLTYAGLAKKLGMAESSVKRMLARGDMPFSRIDAICRALKLAKTFRWRPHGAVMDYFREHALLDYYSGGFDGHGEGLPLVHGSISRSLAPAFMERLQRMAQDFAQQHQADQKLPEKDREGYTLLLAMRPWEFEAFAALRR